MDLKSIRLDPFTLAMLGTTTLALLLPCSGEAAAMLRLVSKSGIAALFFLHGARISPGAALQALGNHRLQVLIFGFTFLLFPTLGMALMPLVDSTLGPHAARGVLFLCVVPSTMQSSIALTALASGNVSVAVCAATLSNLAGLLLTPALAAAVGLTTHGGLPPQDVALSVATQLLLPFALGHLSRRRLKTFVERNKKALAWVDRGAILVVVYTSFSAAVVAGVWEAMPARSIVALVLLSCLLLGASLFLLKRGAAFLGLSRSDEIPVVFCGSQKSLASGVPLAGILFVPEIASIAVLPLMIYHQLQLFVGALIARRYAGEIPHNPASVAS